MHPAIRTLIETRLTALRTEADELSSLLFAEQVQAPQPPATNHAPRTRRRGKKPNSASTRSRYTAAERAIRSKKMKAWWAKKRAAATA